VGSHRRPTPGHIETTRAFDSLALTAIQTQPDTSADTKDLVVNGQPGLVARLDGVVTVFAFDIASDRIRHIWAVRNPEKLRPWTTS
jgi:hypothetical protein